jgi:hypothetical protein
MNKRPKRAPKHGLTAQKIKALRLKCIGKTDEEGAAIMGVTVRQFRRKVDWCKEQLGVFCGTAMVDLVHRLDMGWSSDRERDDWHENHRVYYLRKAA